MVTASKRTTTKPWESRRIWASVLGIILVTVLFLFDQEELALSTAGLVAAYVLSRGVGKIGLGLLLVTALTLGACTLRQAQVATQASLTSIAEATVTADKLLAAETPRLVREAASEATKACGDPCSQVQFTAALDEKLVPITRAVVGLKVARDACLVAQGAQDIWVATGSLPDTGPLCTALGDAVGPVPVLLSDAGVEGIPPEVDALAGPAARLVCETVSRWAKRR